MTDKKTEALKLALKALEYFYLYAEGGNEEKMADKAITAIREALAEQPAQQQEPHCYMDEYGNVHGGYEDWMENEGGWFPVYTSPPVSKPWVGLDNDDLVWIYSNSDNVGQAISNTEAKLKAKNSL